MVVRSLVCCLVVVGCQSNRRDAAPAHRTDLPCTPSVHPNVRRGPPLFEGYRFIAGAADGRRVALALTHMGPGSGQSVGGLHVIEAGAHKEVLDKSYFKVRGTEAELSKVETGIVTDYASDLAAAGVELEQHLPEQQAWCAAPDGAIYTANGAKLELRVTHPQCETDPTHKTVAWQLCSNDAACIGGGGADECVDGTVSLHDLVRTNGTDWAVVDMAIRPFPDSEFHLYEVAGGPLSGS
jgi:hypothetical protein